MTTVDVRDMACAQALALVAQAMRRLPASQALEVRYTTEDVKRDLLAWANDRGYPISDQPPDTLRMTTGHG